MKNLRKTCVIGNKCVILQPKSTNNNINNNKRQ